MTPGDRNDARRPPGSVAAAACVHTRRYTVGVEGVPKELRGVGTDPEVHGKEPSSLADVGVPVTPVVDDEWLKGAVLQIVDWKTMGTHTLSTSPAPVTVTLER